MDEGVARNTVLGEGRGQRTANGFGIHSIFEAHVEGGASRELHTLIEALGGQRANARDDHDGAQRVEATAVSNEVDRRVGEPVLGRFGVEGDVLLVLEAREEDQTRQHNCTEERSENTDDQRRREASNGATAERVEHEGRQQRGDVGVNDGAVSLGIAFFQRDHQAFAATHFFTDALVDEHVGVYRHADGQHDACNAWQRQCCTERGKCANQEEQVGDQGHVGYEAGTAVVENHVCQHHKEGDDKRAQARLDVLFTELRSHANLVHDAGGGRE